MHVVSSLPPISTKDANLGRRLECVIQQPVGVQFQQPLALRNIALPSGQVLRVPRIDPIHLGCHVLRGSRRWGSNTLPSSAWPPSSLHSAVTSPLGDAGPQCNTQIGVPAVNPDPAAQRRNASRSQHRSPLHADGLFPDPGPPIAIAAPILFSFRFRHSFLSVMIPVPP